MSAIAAQVWGSSKLSIDRTESQTQGTVFRLSGPFTARDMFSAMSPDAFRNVFESVPGDDQPSVHVFDLTEVPYMDSMGLGMLASHYARCRSKGIRMSLTGVGPRVQELLRITKMESVFPITVIDS
jgi:anti-anti-sigma factor